jgi:hypothetical protein
MIFPIDQPNQLNQLNQPIQLNQPTQRINLVDSKLCLGLAP